eukprot:355955-Chlamydomonas_euryale.AAC.9
MTDLKLASCSEAKVAQTSNKATRARMHKSRNACLHETSHQRNKAAKHGGTRKNTHSESRIANRKKRSNVTIQKQAAIKIRGFHPGLCVMSNFTRRQPPTTLPHLAQGA